MLQNEKLQMEKRLYEEIVRLFKLTVEAYAQAVGLTFRFGDPNERDVAREHAGFALYWTLRDFIEEEQDGYLLALPERDIEVEFKGKKITPRHAAYLSCVEIIKQQKLVSNFPLELKYRDLGNPRKVCKKLMKFVWSDKHVEDTIPLQLCWQFYQIHRLIAIFHRNDWLTYQKLMISHERMRKAAQNIFPVHVYSQLFVSYWNLAIMESKLDYLPRELVNIVLSYDSIDPIDVTDEKLEEFDNLIAQRLLQIPELTEKDTC